MEQPRWPSRAANQKCATPTAILLTPGLVSVRRATYNAVGHYVDILLRVVFHIRRLTWAVAQRFR